MQGRGRRGGGRGFETSILHSRESQPTCEAECVPAVQPACMESEDCKASWNAENSGGNTQKQKKRRRNCGEETKKTKQTNCISCSPWSPWPRSAARRILKGILLREEASL